MPDSFSNLIFSFDVGTGSLGEAVRRGNKFLHKESLLVPHTLARRGPAKLAGTPANRYRAWQIRKAHKAREAWLDECMKLSGIEPLQRRLMGKRNGRWELLHKGDPRLEREFAAKDDETCYTSCLLRIRLLRGEKLEDWQVYKAFNSAIQKRGYDSEIPWKDKEARRKGAGGDKDDELDERYKEAIDAWGKFTTILAKHKLDHGEYEFPCYYDAWKMGLWNPEFPKVLAERIDCKAGSTRNVVASRRVVEAEITHLVHGAAKNLHGVSKALEKIKKDNPHLKDPAAYSIYGPTGTGYASYYADLRRQFDLTEGGNNDWQGLLGQKVPRFDNRIINKCTLIPRLNVCKAGFRRDGDGKLVPDLLLVAEVSFLMKLKNLRVERDNGQSPLNADEVNELFTDALARADEIPSGEEKWWRRWELNLPPSVQLDLIKQSYPLPHPERAHRYAHRFQA